MDFLRRLVGSKRKSDEEANTQPSRTGATLEITQPGNPVTMTPPAPVIEPPSKAEKAAQESVKVETPRAPTSPFGATRQLPPLESYVGKPGKHLIYGLSSDIGQIRNNNQDAVYAFFSSNVSAGGPPDFGLFVVADGMGGHHDGEKASAITTRMVAKHVTTNFLLPLLNERIDDDPNERPVVSEVLAEAVQKANQAVSDQIPEGGTTVTAAAILGDLVHVAHVGDSRAYLITADGIEQITRDHSLVQRLIELDQLTAEEAAVHPQRNVLYRAIGQSENLEVDAVIRRLPPGSRLLLCSDGLWNQVDETALKEVVLSASSPQEACDRLITAANDRGGPDNITVVIIQAPG